MKWLVKLNIWLYRLTNGVIGGRLAGAKVLLLTTTGRKSGEKRTVPVRYQKHGEDYVIVAANWGKPRHPLWFLNVSAQPHVQIQVGGQKMQAVADVVQGEERDHFYQRFIEEDQRFAHYEETAGARTIPIIVLHPQH